VDALFHREVFMRRKDVLLLLILSLIFSSSVAHAQTSLTPTLAPLGGGITGDLLPGNAAPPPASVTQAEYIKIFQGLAPEAATRAIAGTVKVLVLPSALTPNPDFLTSSQKADLLRVAESRLFQVQEGCKLAMPAGINCQATLIPLYLRTDALDPLVQDYFAQDWSVTLFLGGDPTAAMRVIKGTPVEPALEMLYQEGVIIAGVGGGANILSRSLLAGYQGLSMNTGLAPGTARIWSDSQQHGLLFGIQDALLEHQFYQLGRMGGLLQAISDMDGPHLGIGLDAYTGLYITAGRDLANVFGLYTVTILDAETYGAARRAYYRDCSGKYPCTPALSIRSVLVHLLAPGEYSYDLAAREHSLGAPPPEPDRSYASLTIPPDAGPLILAGDLSENLVGNSILAHFGEICGGEDGFVLVIAAGFPSDSSTERMADWVSAELPGKPVQLTLLKNVTALPAFPKHFSGIVFVVRDQSRLKPELLEPIKEAWLAGVPLLADNGGAAALGAYFSSHGPTPAQGKQHEIATQASFLDGGTQIRTGLGLVDISIEPQIVEDNRWGRLFSLAYHHPSMLAVGLTRDTALEIDHMGARVIGSNVIFVLDLSNAQLGLGDNRSYVIANGLLDVFPSGDDLLVLPQAEGTAGNQDLLSPDEAPTLGEQAPVDMTAIEPVAGQVSESKPGFFQRIKNDWLIAIPLVILVAMNLMVGMWLVRRRRRYER
jgi:cyanophycinase-like exopeptidase